MYTVSGTEVATLSLASNEKYKDNVQTDWHRVLAFSSTAGFLRQYAGMSDRIYVDGRIQYDSWEDYQGKKHNGTKIIANQVQLLGRGSGNNGNLQTEDDKFEPVDDDSFPFQTLNHK